MQDPTCPRLRPEIRNRRRDGGLVHGCWSGGAFGNPFYEVPKEYRGSWCWVSKKGVEQSTAVVEVRKARSLDIDARRFTDGEEAGLDCVPNVLILTNYGDYLVQSQCREGHGPFLLDQRWKLLKGGRRLKVTFPDGVPHGTSPDGQP
jgi:hypothetical protein